MSSLVMQSVAKFRISGSFKITGRGLVAIGDLLEGKVKVGDYLSFNTGTQDVAMKIAGVEMGDNISTREYWVGLTFVYKDEEQRKEFEIIKLKEQVANIWDKFD